MAREVDLAAERTRDNTDRQHRAMPRSWWPTLHRRRHRGLGALRRRAARQRADEVGRAKDAERTDPVEVTEPIGPVCQVGVDTCARLPKRGGAGRSVRMIENQRQTPRERPPAPPSLSDLAGDWRKPPTQRRSCRAPTFVQQAADFESPCSGSRPTPVPRSGPDHRCAGRHSPSTKTSRSRRTFACHPAASDP